ncbi:Acetylxylan esterase 2 [Madurella mycetomatis]|uniref:Acetylxylan esterase 2 n=1 Tax=Madurella mycetomatis TaxID=100816 RepID=A0A175W1S2_9PEZI|nr:Acetylxylan esterase 2 [Madurella mycetomatis]
MKTLVFLSLGLALAPIVNASPPPLSAHPPGQRPEEDDQPCPKIHIFGARETTAPPGFGSSETLVDLLGRAFPGTGAATAEAIVYPAAGGPDYSASVTVGIAAVVKQTAVFAARCPRSVIIVHGYSQGAQIMDDAFCGGPDVPSLNSSVPLVSRQVAHNVAAIILMGSPRHVAGRKGNVGNATAGGFAARPKDFRCPVFEDRIQTYCDSPDPFCSNGTDPETHQGYGRVYGRQALAFVVSKIIV